MTESLAIYGVDEIETYLQTHPEFFDTKKGYELITGCILAKCWEKLSGEEIGIGYELAESSLKLVGTKRPRLETLITKLQVEDRSIDVWLARDRFRAIVQVTRLETRGRGVSSLERLLNLLRKKMQVQTDKKLLLAVLVDETFDLDFSYVHTKLSTWKVPYASIHLIGQFGDSPELGVSQCMEIYPDLLISEEVKLNLEPT